MSDEKKDGDGYGCLIFMMVIVIIAIAHFTIPEISRLKREVLELQQRIGITAEREGLCNGK